MGIFIIAEAGVNHNGNLETAMKLVDAAVAAGADAVKFQTFKANKLVTSHAAKARYQNTGANGNESQLTMLQNLELKYEYHFLLRDYCRRQGILFLSTAFDSESLRFLLDEVGVVKLKIPSGEITNGPFLLEHGQSGLPIILSTGMATMGEVETALGVLAFAYLGGDKPSLSAFQEAYGSDSGQAMLKNKVTLLHCTSAYPTPMAQVNLQAMDVLRHAFGLAVGYSDHTLGLAVPIAAAARGAVILEKHFTLDKSQLGPDHQVSLEPEELKQMIQAVRAVEQAIGQSGKSPQPIELENRDVARKSLVAGREIAAGDCYSVENLTSKRPGGGLSPMEFWRLLGRTSSRDYKPDDLIE